MTTATPSMTVREFFQKEYIDTKQIKQSFIEKYQGKTKGHKPNNIPSVKVGDLTFTYNGRRPKASTIKSYIEKEGGLNWYLFGSCQIAQVNEQQDLWDTLHRAILACTVLGPDAEVPAITTNFDTGSHVHSTFWKANGGSIKKVTPEQIFIAQIKSNDPEPQMRFINTILEQTKDVVVFEEKEIYEPRNNDFVWHINVGPMKQMLIDIKDPKYILEAIDLYKKSFSHIYASEKPKPMIGQLITAFSMIFLKNSEWFKNSTKGKSNLDHFEDWVAKQAVMTTKKYLTRDWLYKEHEHDRQEKRYLGTALGIWERFVDHFRDDISGGSACPLISTIKHVYENSKK